jgi:hypothetical protein
MDPYDNRTWVLRLHTLHWALPLLDAYALDGDNAALVLARDLALDWATAARPGDPTLPRLAWNDKTVGDRAGRLAYLTRAAACEGLLTDAQAGALIDSLREHAAFLVDPANHPRDNHGLYVDYGLALLAYHLPFLPEAGAWRDLASERFAGLLAEELASSGLFLEHSPAYQLLVVDLVEAMVRVAPDPWLSGALARMRSAAGWFVLPGGTLVPLGDSPPGLVSAPWLIQSARAASGLLADFEAGLGAVKRGGGYLAVTAWFHGPAHRQDDDLSFHLRDGRRDVISDSGHFSYQLDRWDRFQRSAAAHSGLAVDGFDFPSQRSYAYGSGLRAAGRGSGWFAIEGKNPLVRRLGVQHRRLFLYRPALGLVVVDRLRSRRRHSYVRRFQVGPGVGARSAPGGWRLAAPGFRGFVAPGPRTDGRSAVRGRLSPIAGWSFPRFLEREPRWTLAARTRAEDADLISAIGLRGRLRARIVRRAGEDLVLAVRQGRDTTRLTISRRGRRLGVVAR